MQKFVVQSVLSGVIIALFLVYFFPGILLPQPHTNSVTTSQPDKPKDTVVSYHDAITSVAPAVVNVYATQILTRETNPLLNDPIFRRFFGDPIPDQKRNNNLGSGVIINGSGHVLTNAHVIENASDILITLSDGRQSKGQIVGIDKETDLAVLQINLDDLPYAPIGNSNFLKVGDIVLAIGNPYDFGQTITQGIVSATGRSRLGVSVIEDFIQTDAAINPGNSGGALINAKGELIGINTAIFSNSGGSQGIGFAIPIDLAISVMQQLISNGFVVRGWLGIEAQPVPMDISKAANLDDAGVLVMGVFNNSPAAKAGIMPGDIITEINGKPLLDSQQTIQQISQLQPSEKINLSILLGWRKLILSNEVSQRPKFSQ